MASSNSNEVLISPDNPLSFTIDFSLGQKNNKFYLTEAVEEGFWWQLNGKDAVRARVRLCCHSMYAASHNTAIQQVPVAYRTQYRIVPLNVSDLPPYDVADSIGYVNFKVSVTITASLTAQKEVQWKVKVNRRADEVKSNSPIQCLYALINTELDNAYRALQRKS